MYTVIIRGSRQTTIATEKTIDAAFRVANQFARNSGRRIRRPWIRSALVVAIYDHKGRIVKELEV